MNFYMCKNNCLLLLFLLFISPIFAAESRIGTVRYIELIALHPRMQSFDYNAMRFIDGPSAQYPLSQLEQVDKQLTEELEQLSAQATLMQQQFLTTLAGEPKQIKAEAEKEYWAHKQSLDNKIEKLRSEIIANISAMELGGRSIETTLLIEVNNIMKDIKQAIDQAAQENNCNFVINEMVMPALNREEWIEESFAQFLGSKAELPDPELLEKWLINCDLIASRLPTQSNLYRPVLSENIDLTYEAIKILYKPATRRGSSK